MGDTSPNHNSNCDKIQRDRERERENIETLHSTIKVLWTLWVKL